MASNSHPEPPAGSIRRLEFPTLLPAPIADVWRITTDFDFVVYLMKPWFTITYDKSGGGHLLAGGWTRDTDWKLFGIIPYGRWHEQIIEWNPPHRFVDLIGGSPFKFWRHSHIYEERGTSTLYTDSMEIDPGWMGATAIWCTRLLWIPRRRKLRQYFEKRHLASQSK
ncbi:MAG TPA: hypothetical protein VIO57_03810 [Chloroflexota bacterium]|jgi:ligand-binding SRPBCC domain-containing protein